MCIIFFLLFSSLTLWNEILVFVMKSLLPGKRYITPSPLKIIDSIITVIVVNGRNRSDRQMGFAPGNSFLSMLQLLLSQQGWKAQWKKHSCVCVSCIKLSAEDLWYLEAHGFLC